MAHPQNLTILNSDGLPIDLEHPGVLPLRIQTATIHERHRTLRLTHYYPTFIRRFQNWRCSFHVIRYGVEEVLLHCCRLPRGGC
jgi:hypothetical protein